MKELFWWLNQSNPSKGRFTPEHEESLDPDRATQHYSTWGGGIWRFVVLNWFSESAQWTPKIVGSLLPVVLLESDVSVLTLSVWGIHGVQRRSWSFSPKCCHRSAYRCNLFWNTGEPNETMPLEHSERWKVAWGQMWVSRAALWLRRDDITSNFIWSPSWPGVCNFVQCYSYYLLPFPSLFLPPALWKSSLCLAMFHYPLWPPPPSFGSPGKTSMY